MGQVIGSTFDGSATANPVLPTRADMWDGPGAATLGNLTAVWFLFFDALAAVSASAPRKYSQALTPPATSFTLAHNLNTFDVVIQIYSSAHALVVPASISLTDANNAVVTLSGAGTGRATVIG